MKDSDFIAPNREMWTHISAALTAARGIRDKQPPAEQIYRQDLVHRHNIALLHAAKAEMQRPGDIARADATIANLQRQLLEGGLNV